MLTKLSGALALTLILTACSVTQAGPETTKTVLNRLERTLPTASVNDTVQTKLEVGTHRKVFFAICEGLGYCLSKSER